jgi:hypothetical protein
LLGGVAVAVSAVAVPPATTAGLWWVTGASTGSGLRTARGVLAASEVDVVGDSDSAWEPLDPLLGEWSAPDDPVWFEPPPLPSELPLWTPDAPLPELSLPLPCGTQPVEGGAAAPGEVSSGAAGAAGSVVSLGASAVSPAASAPAGDMASRAIATATIKN